MQKVLNNMLFLKLRQKENHAVSQHLYTKCFWFFNLVMNTLPAWPAQFYELIDVDRKHKSSY